MRFTLLVVAALALANVSFAAPAPSSLTSNALNHKDAVANREAINYSGTVGKIGLTRRSENEGDEDEGDEDAAPPAPATDKTKSKAKSPVGNAAGGVTGGAARGAGAAAAEQEEKEEGGSGLPTEAVTGALGGITKGLPASELLAGGVAGTKGPAGGLPLDTVTGIVTGAAGNGLPTDQVTSLASGITGSGLPTDQVTSLAGGVTKGGLPTDGVTQIANGLPVVKGVASGL